MTHIPARKPILLAALAVLALLAFDPATAQQAQNNDDKSLGSYPGAVPHGYYVERGPRGVGGYSLRFSDIWGPAKMPPAPMDFGPHFDYPPESLNSTPLHDPYPN
jgi:hypothetical protein